MYSDLSAPMALGTYASIPYHPSISYISDRLSDLGVFYGLLGVAEKRTSFHVMCRDVIEKQDGPRGPQEEPTLFIRLIVKVRVNTMGLVTSGSWSANCLKRHLLDALSFAGFLIEAGWYASAVKVLKVVEDACKHIRDKDLNGSADNRLGHFLGLVLSETQLKLLHGYSAYCNFTEADKLYQQMSSPPEAHGSCDNAECQKRILPSKYSEMSYYCFVKSDFHSAYRWSMKAVELLDKDHSPRVIVDVLRTASKACVVKGLFQKAKLLIQEAVLLAKEVYGSECHPKYADCLMDLGFYLQNSDGASASVQAYEKALAIRTGIFGRWNLLTSLGHEDVAYASYVYEYSTGHFSGALSNSKTALEVMDRLLPENHLLMASAKRVCALILEEIAIDDRDKDKKAEVLKEAEELHLCALALSTATFGQMNIQTAKHYGNLGRLYQSMEQCSKAEEMHLKAIHIKEELLGKDDYEVALSVGHLASLYNYDMKEYAKAESLHLRSIDLGLKLFGPSYSGLEYDYRGLIKIHRETENFDKLYEYQMKLSHWMNLREDQVSRHQNLPSNLLENDSSGDSTPRESKHIGHILSAVKLQVREEEESNESQDVEMVSA